MEDTIKLEYIVSAEDFTRAGEASSDLKNILKQMGVSPDTVRKVSIAMYEGEINMVIHSLQLIGHSSNDSPFTAGQKPVIVPAAHT